MPIPSPLWYVYPMWHRVSFTVIAEKHIEYLEKRIRIHRIDELAFPHITPHSKPIVFIHPFFFTMVRASKFIARKLHLYGALVGIDVADSDHISGLAVSITNYARAMIVPSRYAREVYIKSGVSCPVYVVPHGVDPEWYVKEPSIQYFRDLMEYKKKKGLKYLLYFLWHSDYRKGADLVYEFYKRLKKERNDVVLVFKTSTEDGEWVTRFRKLGVIHVYGWLTEDQKRELYDLADIYTLFSRGGGFELNGLEALSRETIVLAPDKGSWIDYIPKWSLVPSRQCPYVLKDNAFHDGRGYEVIVEKAVDLAHHILDNLEDYKARLREYIDKKIKRIYNWSWIAEQLLNIYFTIRDTLRR